MNLKRQELGGPEIWEQVPFDFQESWFLNRIFFMFLTGPRNLPYVFSNFSVTVIDCETRSLFSVQFRRVNQLVFELSLSGFKTIFLQILSLNGAKLPLKSSVHYISFSAHTDYEQTSEFIRLLMPNYIVLVHGEQSEMGRLR